MPEKTKLKGFLAVYWKGRVQGYSWVSRISDRPDAYFSRDIDSVCVCERERESKRYPGRALEKKGVSKIQLYY